MALAWSTPVDRVDRHLGQRLGPLDGELLDLHAALVGGHREEGAVGAVEQEGDVVLLLDVRARVDEHPVHRVALDVHAEDLLGVGPGVVRGLGDLHAAGLAAAADLDLRLDDGDAAELLGDRLRPRPASSATSPRLTGTPCFGNSCLAWYSNRSTLTPSYLLAVDPGATSVELRP